MTYLLLQTFLLLLASYFLGAFVACTVKRALFGSREEVPAHVLAPLQADVAVGPPVVIPPQPVRPRPTQPVMSPVTPRAIDPVQPKIEVLRRPEPRPAPAVLDPSRFERALTGPHFNEGIPRVAIVEICPAVLPPVTDIYQPAPPELPPQPAVEELHPDVPEFEDAAEELTEPEPEPTPEPEPEPEAVPEREPRAGGLAARLRDATTAAAAGAVAAAKAAAAASIAMPGMGLSRREAVKEAPVGEPAPRVEEAIDEQVVSASGHAADDHREEAAEDPQEPVEAAAEPPMIESEAETLAEEEEEPEAEPQADSQPQSHHDAPEEFEPAVEPDDEPQIESQHASEPTPEPEPVVPAPVAAAALIEDGDDFQRIRAIDSDIEQKLKARGIVYFEHIAGWSASDVRRIGQELEMPGRIDREQWVEQAQILAKGGETYYSRNRKAMLKAKAEAAPVTETKAGPSPAEGSSASGPGTLPASPSQPAEGTVSQREGLSGVAAASQGRSVAEMAAAAAAAIAASSASVTRGLKPIEPISPLSKVDPKISMPARITDAIREKGSSAAAAEIAPANEALPEVASEGPFDDLKRIRGIGVLIEKRLNAMGIRRYDQIANWTSGDIDRVSRMLEFKGRIERESWVEQARILASGGYTEFSRRVDRGEVDTSRET